MRISTVCYIQYQDQVLMLYRNKKDLDVNRGKWIGLGGKLEAGESPDEAMKREVLEESGIVLDNYKTLGLLTFCYEALETEYIFVYKATVDKPDHQPCNEGELAWIPKQEIMNLPLWEGDKIFLPLVLQDQEANFFSIKLQYNKHDQLIHVEHY